MLKNRHEWRTTIGSQDHRQIESVPVFTQKFLLRELEIWPRLRHRHIVQVERMFQIQDRIYIFMELAPGGSVIEYVQRYGAVDEDMARNWCKRMCQALRYCHKKGVAHRDLKCDNLLLDKDLQVKIGDFGFCCRSVDPWSGSHTFSDTYCGSSSYVAPEVIESQPYDPIAADIWSAGVCIYVILNNAMPFDDTNLTRMHEDQITKRWDFSPKVKKTLSQSAQKLVARMLEPMPAKRPSMDQVLNCSWMKMRSNFVILKQIMGDADFEQQLKLEELERKRKELSESGVSDPDIYVDPKDGTIYEWDMGKKAYFPKIDDDFIVKYQSNYNYQPPAEETKDDTPDPDSKGEKRKASEPSWFEIDDAHNTKVYVTGLPLDITEQDFVELMGKCGLILKDPATMKYKVKLYREKGQLKGDGLCCYIKIESVTLALDILDGYLYKGKKIHVERAKFQQKGDYDPSKKPKKLKAKEKEKMKKKQERLFEWGFEKLRGERSRHENTVIIKNMFDPKEFDEDPTLLLDYQKDIREECTSKCGEVKKVVIYDRNPEGVVAVTFATPEMADECINLMNGRWFASRQLTAETWDGKTKYKIVESAEEHQKRIKSWDSFLEGKNSNSESNSQNKQIDSKRSVSSSVYELAGDTDSSGDSDSEGKSKQSNQKSNGGFVSKNKKDF
ncbi:HIV Tat-specific factor 1 homolog [Caerostris extrusa]|uniref:17S U2 SnRNP complex component HTATSF1 n=1 Tax=Caerostris extrusa TaxID=172846 RepID=A0AAV4V2Z0_CAEEX|nr:HIV Tat-specific factor 1 homolog [Caerostris extrusa]